MLVMMIRMECGILVIGQCNPISGDIRATVFIYCHFSIEKEWDKNIGIGVGNEWNILCMSQLNVN